MNTKEVISIVENAFKNCDYLYMVNKTSDEGPLGISINNANGLCFSVEVKDGVLSSNVTLNSIPGAPELNVKLDDDVAMAVDMFVGQMMAYTDTCANQQYPRPSKRYCDYLMEEMGGGNPDEVARCPNILLKCERCQVKKDYDLRKNSSVTTP